MYFGSKRKSAARRLKLRDRIISMLLAVSLLCGNPIVLPTGAAELVAYCEIEEHSHSEECYTTERVLTCGVTQDNHVHSEACKQTEKTLTCTIVEQVHEHTDACYTTTTNLTCTEHVHTADCAQLTCTDEGHAHTDACYAYTCESPNSTHQHTDSCYTTESVLKCDYHQHTDECYTTTEVNTCGVTQDNHTHSYACYGGEKTLSCTQEEHTHTSACYSNPEADLETADDWKDTLPKEDDFTGTWAKDLLAVAESQLGYKESDKNYQVAEDGETPMGYNRYGAWYSSYTQDENQPYAPWNVIFLFFSIYYSGISDFPLEETCADWVESLDYYDLYREVGKTYPVSEEDTEGEAYTPNPGDLVFTDTGADGVADRVGIVSEWKEDLLTGKTTLTAIEGDVDGAVAEVTYDLSDTEAAAAAEVGEDPQPQILGYADMTTAQGDAVEENADASVLADWSGKYIYLDYSNKDWPQDNAKIYLAYKISGSSSWAWLYSNTSVTADGRRMIQFEVPDDMDRSSSNAFKFARINPSASSPSWDTGTLWNQAPGDGQNTSFKDGKNIFKLSDWNAGSWDGYYDSGSGDDESESVDTLPEVADGCRRVFYDATLSSLNDETGSNYGTVDYWVFDSRDTTLQMKYDSTSGYWLDDSTSDVYGSTPDKDKTTDRNFFPFNSSAQSAKSQQLNYGFATKLEFTFRLTEDGTVVSSEQEDIPIEFNFSGDDDVWVFIDGQLALDVGGGHGRVSGYLNFRDKTYYVSRVKNSDSGVTYSKTDNFTINGNNTDEHTLTMFYMERGLWESNMMITFNFPDENLLEVEKVVDKTAVNQDLFGGLFDNKSMFTFNIKNLATHYGTVAVSTDTVDPVTLDTTDTSGKVSLTAYGSNIFDRYKLTAFGSDDSVVHWYAHETDSTSDYREKRYGNLWLNTGTGSPNIVDLSKMAYMEFEVYFQDSTPSLSKMYIQLKDTKDNILTKSDSQKQYLSSCVYGTVTPVANNWFKIRLSLSSMLALSLTEETILQYIRFGYNEPVNIYLRGFKFLPAISASESNVGFVKQEYTIPDYGSVTTGVLQPAAGAVYTSNITSLARATANAVDADGNFVLSAGETASFYNQFRRGSYISLTENVSGDLFDTSWTIYEGGKAVTQMGTGSTVTNSTPTVSVNNVSGTAVDDGRTEEYATGATDGHTIENSYKGTKPDANTFVFRSFSNPDNAVSATKLKVVFTNKVKTGSLTIHKKQAGSVDLTGEFTFYVVFTNVGGMSLESNPITVGPFKLSAGGTKTISGIPLNTEYAIYEIKPEDEEITLDHVKVGGAEVTYTVTTYGDSSAYMTTGTVTANDSDNSHTVEYYNINKPVVSLTLTKKWEGVDKDEDRPRSIRVQLQYSMDEGNTWNPIEGYYKDRTIGPGYAKWSDYTYTFADLDKYKYDEDGNDEAEYMYRVVELDSEGKVIDADGTVTIGGVEFKVSYGTTGMADLVPDTTNEYTQTITNTVIPTVTLKITKLDATDQTKLAGVVFKLEKDGSTIGTQNTGTDGIATFAELKAGSYTLTETKTAEGYSLLKSAITVVIANDGTATVDGNNANITTGTDGVKTIELTIYNKKNLSMPSTGGVYGFEYWILGGLCITAVPLLLYTLFGFKKGGKYRRR